MLFCQLLVHFGKGVHGEFQVCAGMRCGYLCANARGAVWNDRIEEADHVNALLQHVGGELLRFRRGADHDRDDRMHAGLNR